MGRDAHESAEIRLALRRGKAAGMDPRLQIGSGFMARRRGRDAQLAVEDHRLETLGAHDGASPDRAHAAPVVADARDERRALAGGPMTARGPGAVSAGASLRSTVSSPTGGSVRSSARRSSRTGRRGPPLAPREEVAVEPFRLMAGRQFPSAVGIFPGAGQGGLPDDAPAAREVAGGSRQEPRDEPQDVVGAGGSAPAGFASWRSQAASPCR